MIINEQLKKVEEDLLGSLPDLDDAGRILADFLHGGAASTLLNGLVEQCLGGGGRDFLAVLGGESYVLVQNEHFTLYLKMLSAGPYLTSTGTDRVTAFRPPEGVTIDTYAIDGDFNPEVFDPGARLRLVESRTAGATWLVQRRSEALVHDFRSTVPALCAGLNLAPASSQVWMFDRASLNASFPTLSQRDLSGYVLFSKMVAATGANSAVSVLEQLCTHPSHAVRWAAVQALARLDGRTARERLGDMADDSHPHVRESARKVLARMAG